MDSNIFPDRLKIAKVKTIHKTGDKMNLANYRPISILPALSKIFEIVLKNQINAYLEENNIIDQKQYGFQKQSSTTAAVTQLLYDITSNLENGKKTACLFLDIRKAFDCLNHKSLIIILQKIGFEENALKLLANYLVNRKQFVVINDIDSTYGLIRRGVPQGSVLGPLLFTIYINNIFKLQLHGKPQCFADDTVLVYAENDFTILKQKMEQDLQTLHTWLNMMSLSLNIEKTKFILFRRKNQNLDNIFDTITIENIDNPEIIACTKTYNYLGLIIDECLTFSNHIKKVIRWYSKEN
jgi:hypothetical protein